MPSITSIPCATIKSPAFIKHMRSRDAAAVRSLPLCGLAWCHIWVESVVALSICPQFLQFSSLHKDHHSTRREKPTMADAASTLNIVNFTNFYFFNRKSRKLFFFFVPKIMILKQKPCISSRCCYGKLFPPHYRPRFKAELNITDKMMSKSPKRTWQTFDRSTFSSFFWTREGGRGVHREGGASIYYM